MHCYLRGTGVEIMANSDNVLRCGLTPKHIDVAELLKITDFSELADPRWPRTRRRLPGAGSGLPRCGPSTDAVEVTARARASCCARRALPGSAELAIARGHAAFVAAGEAVAVRTDGVAFVASIG